MVAALDKIPENKNVAENIVAINKLTLKDRIRGYKNRPFSLLLLGLVSLAALITVSVFLLIIGYIFVKGIPNLNLSLFEWTYNTDNVSMLPAIINTFL